MPYYQNKLFSFQNTYQPYFVLDGAKYLNRDLGVAEIYELFIPLLITDDNLFFTDQVSVNTKKADEIKGKNSFDANNQMAVYVVPQSKIFSDNIDAQIKAKTRSLVAIEKSKVPRLELSELALGAPVAMNSSLIFKRTQSLNENSNWEIEFIFSPMKWVDQGSGTFQNNDENIYKSEDNFLTNISGLSNNKKVINTNDVSSVKKITNLNYEYSNFDIERLLIYALSEFIDSERENGEENEVLGTITLTSPVYQKDLRFIFGQDSRGSVFSEWFKDEAKISQKKLLIPVYLENEKHWANIILENKKDGDLEIKYFDSSFGVESKLVSYDWLKVLIEKAYNKKVSFVHGEALQQSDSSVGCGAFAVENAIRGLGVVINDFGLNEERLIRRCHNELLEKHKNKNIASMINDLRNQGVGFINVNNILSLNGVETIPIFRGGKKENDIKSSSKVNDDDSLFQKSYHMIHQIISNSEYLLVPLSGAIAGGVRWGWLGVIAGGVMGAADETLVYLGCTDRYYLTWGNFGIATGHTIKPSVVSDITGVVIGILLPTGVLDDHKELVAPVISAIATGSITGVDGVVNGGAFGVIDELSIHSGITDNHYLTFCAVGMSVVNLLGLLNSMPIVADSIGIILGLIVVNYEDKIITTWVPITLTKDLYATYNKFLPEKQLASHVEKQALILLGSQFIIQSLDLKSIEHEQGLFYNFERLDVPNSPAWGGFQSRLFHFAIFVFPYIAGQTFSAFINDYFSTKLHFTLEDKIRAKWLVDETALRLSCDNDTAVLIDNLKTDVFAIADSGSKLITDAASSTVKGIYGLGIIMVGAPDIMIYSVIYSQACTFFSEYLAKQQRACEEQIKVQESKLTNIIKHDNKNLRTITERDGIEFTQRKLQKSYDALREHEVGKKIWGSAISVWRSGSRVTDFMFNLYLVGYKVNLGLLPFENRVKVHAASRQVSSLLSWVGKNSVEITSAYQSLDRINSLTEKMYANSIDADQITRITKVGNQLILHDVEVTIEDKTLVTIDHLELEMGKAYAITGDSGSGKTSLLSKIKGIKGNGVGGRGTIYYPLVNGKEAKIVMISQQDYFPVDSTLLEVIFYPNEAPKESILFDKKRDEIQALLKQMKFGAFSVDDIVEGDELDNNENVLDSIKDWYTALSGGEKKKVIITSAIVKKPDILILDEIFTGLDGESISLIQGMLKKCLPNTLILVIDHHAQDNNHDFFYDKELHFYNKKIIFEDVSEENVIFND